MSGHDMHNDRDAELRRALRAAMPQPPLDAVDWDGLQRRIALRAAPHLARPRTRATLWSTLSGWAAHGVPMAAAAAALVLIALNMPARATSASGPLSFLTIEEELAGEVYDGGTTLLTAGASDADLLDALLFYDGEDRP